MTNYGDYRAHPLLEMFPIFDADLRALAKDIGVHGLLVPIALAGDGTTIVDGRLRYLACKDAGVLPRFEHLPPLDDFEVACRIMALNARRRHLSVGARAVVAAEQEAFVAIALRERWMNSPTVPQGRRPRAIVAEWHCVSETSVQIALLVLRRAPQLAQAVKRGDKSLNAAAAELKRPKPPKARPARAHMLPVAPLQDQIAEALTRVRALIDGLTPGKLAPQIRRQVAESLREQIPH